MKIKSIIYLTLFILTGIVPANAWNWDFDPNKYNDYMPATVVLLDDKGNNYGSPDIEIVAFNGEEIRGVGSRSTWEADKQYVYYINVYTNPDRKVDVVFKAFYKATGAPVVLNGKEIVTAPVEVNTSGKIGDVEAPAQIQPEANLQLKAIRVKEDVQTYTANDYTRQFILTTYPANISGFTVQYQQNGATVSPKKSGSYDVIISRKEDRTYQAYNRTLPGALVIDLSAPTVTWPTGLKAEEGKQLSTVALTGGTGEGTFSWSNAAYTFDGSGTYMMEAVFTPANLLTHHVVKEYLEVEVAAIRRTSIAITADATQKPVYDGTAKAFAFTPSVSSLSDFTVSYKKEGITVENAIDAGTYDVIVSRQQDDTYKAFYQTFKGGLVIEQGTPTAVTWPTSVILDSGGRLSDAVMTGQSGEGIFSWDNGNTTPSGTTNFNEKLNFIPTNKNYKTISNQVLVTVKVLISITIGTTPQSFPYDGTEKAFVVTPTSNSASNFTVSYSQDGTAVTAPTNAGTYDVKVSRPSDDTYKAFEASLPGALVISRIAYPKEEEIPWPQDLSLYAGSSLANLALPSSTKGKFTWVSPELTFSPGKHTAEMLFTPADKNYLTVTKTVTFTVIEAPISPTYQISITLSEGGTLSVRRGSENISSGTRVDKNTVLTLHAVPDKNYKFSHYLVNDQQSVSNEVIVTNNMTLKAVFVPDSSTSIEEDAMKFRFYSESGILFVSTPVALKLQIVALSGTVAYEKTVNGQEQVDGLQRGVYLLVFTDASGRKCVKKVVL